MTVFGLPEQHKQLPDAFENRVFDSDIRSVWLGNSLFDFALPVIELNSEEKLELRFDDLSGDSRLFGYTFIHCDTGWKQSQLSQSEYLEGFGKGIITDSRQSFNTTTFYINHRVQLPQEDCMPVVSGNYVIVVYEESDPEKIILTCRFYITENIMNIEALVRRPLFGLESHTGQQVLFSVNYNNREVRDPAREISTFVVQNNRSDKILRIEKPYTLRTGRLEYNDPEGNIFNAGNEFRSIDLKNIRYQSENVASIEFRNPYYHFILNSDKQRANKPWFTRSDINGNYYIDREKSADRHTEADYVYVHFSLELPVMYSEEQVFVSGAFNNWSKDNSGLMKFNPETGLFETTLLLKQGLYDYCYLMEDPVTKSINEYGIEGSFYETENDYSIFVYFHDQFNRYDRLTGFLPIK